MRALWEEVKSLQQNEVLAKAVKAETHKRAIEFIAGLHKYQSTTYTRPMAEMPSVLQIGNSRLLDFGARHKNSPCILLVPSLINRYYILDLTKKLSFARYLSEQNIHVFVLDWGNPGSFEDNFNCAMYITEILMPMAHYIRKKTSNNFSVAGYCMGGLFTLALAAISPDLCDRIALFSTPWDFSSIPFPIQGLENLREYITRSNTVPATFIHLLFHIDNPYLFQNKLRDFAALQNPQAIHDFLAIEHWVNDGVAMTSNVAIDCLINWAHYNQTARLEWSVDGQIVDPVKIKHPAFLAAPQNDTIVPLNSALPLAGKLFNPHVISPPTGHIGMIVGKKRKSALWQHFAKWVLEK